MTLTFKDVDEFPNLVGTYIYIDNAKYELKNQPLILNLEKESYTFYVKNWWMKSKKHIISKKNGNQSIEVRRFLNIKSYVLLISVLVLVMILVSLKVKYSNYLAIIFGLSWILYHLYVLTIGQKNYFNISIVKDKK